jgi:formamidopyrimidine-DNA glycosylase
MPELPEVETIRTGIAPSLVGRRLERVVISDPLLTRPEPPEAIAAELTGETIRDVGRRGKYLVVAFESGRHLLIHLRMTGGLRRAAGDEDADPYQRARLTLDDGSDVAYRDVRRFGTWLLLDPDDLEPYLGARVGPEPLARGFTATTLAAALAGRRAPLKAALLDQRTVAGVGNIYADEALWWSGLHPRRVAGSLDATEVARLRDAVRKALRLGIRRQGATLNDYRGADGSRGRMQEEFRVYGREGEPCGRCGTPIVKTRVAGRGTWYCPSCQREEPEP